MRSFLLLILSALCASGALAQKVPEGFDDLGPAYDFRLWTSNDGRTEYARYAPEYLHVMVGAEVPLIRENGSRVKLPVARLSQADQSYLSRQGYPNLKDPLAKPTTPPPTPGYKDWDPFADVMPLSPPVETQQQTALKIEPETNAIKSTAYHFIGSAARLAGILLFCGAIWVSTLAFRWIFRRRPTKRNEASIFTACIVFAALCVFAFPFSGEFSPAWTFADQSGADITGVFFWIVVSAVVGLIRWSTWRGGHSPCPE